MSTTRRIAGHTVSLERGRTYRAARPMASGCRGETFTVTITALDTGEHVVTLPGLSYDASNRFLLAFNNGASSFDGRVW